MNAVLYGAAALVVVAAVIAIVRSGELRRDRVPVLIYHRLVARGKPLREEDRGERGCIVFDDEFRDHLRALNAAGYTRLSPQEFALFRQKRARLPARPVMITFDDGWRSVHELALPALREAGMTATIFMNTVRDNPNFRDGEPADGPLTDEMLEAWSGAGNTIGSHGASHVFLTTCTKDELQAELVESKRALERLVRKPVVALAAPGGQSDARVAAAARRAGYEMLFGGGSGTINGASDLYALPRLGVERDTPGDRLVVNLTPAQVLLHRMVRAWKRVPTRLLGPEASNALRRKLVSGPFAWLLSVRVLKLFLAAGSLFVLAALLWLVLGR